MASLTAPGVYVEEIPSGVRPIQAAGTSTAAFFGEAERGPIGEMKQIFNFTEYRNIYGNFLDGGRYLAHSVLHFFENGGATCYIGRVANGAEVASVTVLDRAPSPDEQDTLTISASSAGVWGNRIMVEIDSDASNNPGSFFNLTVLQDNPDPDGDPIVLETFADLSMDSGSANFVDNIVNSQSQYIETNANESNTNQIPGFSQSADIQITGSALIGTNQREFRININGDGFRTVDITQAMTGADPASVSDIETAIRDTIQAMTPLRESTDVEAYSQATVTFTDTASIGVLAIAAGHPAAELPPASSSVIIQDADEASRNVAGALNLGLRHGGTEILGSANMRPQNSAADDPYLLGDDTTGGAVSDVEPGTDGSTVDALHFLDVFSWLDTIRDVSLIAAPGIGSTDVINAGMNYCASRPLGDCFYIADMDIDDDTFEEARAFPGNLDPTTYGAVYWPWLTTIDRTGVSQSPVPVPPSGFMAGLYSRIDARRGVWKAPAGTEAFLSGVNGLVTHVTDVQQGLLNNEQRSVSVIRKFPNSGFVPWGTRTIGDGGDYKYIPVRRLAIMLKKSIYDGIQWAVFEPNDEPLWAELRLNIGTFMHNLFRQGAFQGGSPKKAYFVKCDSETTTQADIDLGIVNVLVGFAPLKPAEFVVVKIQQKTAEAA